jgi:trigger factor
MSQDAAVAEFEYPISVEDSGPAAKKITIEIPEDRIKSKMEEQFNELQEVATLPGFRAGKAPRALLEKRFAGDLKKQVRDTLVRESYQQALEKHSLKVIGEPEFDNEGALELPTSGALKYTFSVEVTPEIALPDLAELTVKKPIIKVTDEHVEQALQNLREQQGTLIPVDGRGVKEKDYITADIAIKLGDELIGNQFDTQVIARSSKIGDIEIKDLGEQLAGANVDETRTIKATAPDNHPAEKIRGQEVTIEIKVKDIKELELATIDEEFLDALGFVNAQELNEELRKQMVERIENDVKVAMHNQVRAYLNKNLNVELPAKLSKSQESRIVNRRANELMMRGMGVEQIRANLDRLTAGAADQARNELKLFFALSKIAADNNIEVDESEVNGQIAYMAMMQNQRPEKLKQTMANSGQLSDLWLSLREKKALDKLLETAKIEEVEIKGDDAQSVSPDAKDIDEHSQGETPSDEAKGSDAT